MKKLALLNRVRALVAEVTRVRFAGAAYSKLSCAQGYADGYMSALIDAGLVDRDELLRAIGEERQRVVSEELQPA